MQIISKFDMGDTVKDDVTGYEGVVVAITHYMTGCTHASLQAKKNKEGKVPEWESFEETRMTLVKKVKVPKVAKAPIGGHPRHMVELH
jgi:hypothetical protein